MSVVHLAMRGMFFLPSRPFLRDERGDGVKPRFKSQQSMLVLVLVTLPSVVTEGRELKET